ncbi:Exo-glucosaminidase LytG [termite gut metagenome]|uniref:Peptidoglycan hydrolase n=1 Tax=termite gut metagenome TaxID=433724 RepID=A0A5J4RF04_9ZZZZ
MGSINHKPFVLIFFIIPAIIHANAQAEWRSQLYIEYIDKYSDIAVEQMKAYKIPASITLAQGLLESGAGKSSLARKHNNHFGIKCGGDWKGNTAQYDDDHRNECFRAYRNSTESYEDHSLFLSGRARYASLFQLKITDYEGWAHGLKKAGYATAPKYAIQLISIIENYELYKYDIEGKDVFSQKIQNPHQVYLSNDLVYVIVRDRDTFESIGKEFDVSKKKLLKYNDLPQRYTLTKGNIIYLHKKKNKAQKTYTVHVVKESDSMHSISQTYGIRLKSLYKMSHKKADYVPEVGARLKLR